MDHLAVERQFLLDLRAETRAIALGSYRRAQVERKADGTDVTAADRFASHQRGRPAFAAVHLAARNDRQARSDGAAADPFTIARLVVDRVASSHRWDRRPG